MILYMDFMLYFNKLIHVGGCNLSILWSLLKRECPTKFQLAIWGSQFLTPGEDPDSQGPSQDPSSLSFRPAVSLKPLDRQKFQ